MIAAGKFIDCVLCLYGPDGKFHFKLRYQDLYNEGEFDVISEEEFEEFKKKMDRKENRGCGKEKKHDRSYYWRYRWQPL